MTEATEITERVLLRFIEAASWDSFWRSQMLDSHVRGLQDIAHYLGGPDPDRPVMVQRRADRACSRGLSS
jgi:hypothetical protein